MYTALTDFVILVWVIALLSIVVPDLVGTVLPENAGMINATAANASAPSGAVGLG